MDVRNCIRCGKTFTYLNKPICPECATKDEEEFEQVRSFIKENRGCSPHEVFVATGVPVKRIMKYIRDGRIEVEKNTSFAVTCEKCGKEIPKGRLCKACQAALNIQLVNFMQPERKEMPPKPKAGSDSKGMHYKKDK